MQFKNKSVVIIFSAIFFCFISNNVFISSARSYTIKHNISDDYEKMKCRKKLASFDASLKELPLNEVIAEK